MQQPHTFGPRATARSQEDSELAMDHTDAFEAAMTVLRNAGVGFVILGENEPMEQAA